MIPGLPENHSIARAVGAAYEEAIAVGGILEGNILLAVIGNKEGEPPVGYDVSLFEVSDGAITSETQDTDGYDLTVIYA